MSQPKAAARIFEFEHDGYAKEMRSALLTTLVLLGCSGTDTVQKTSEVEDAALDTQHRAVSKEVYDCYLKARALANGDVEPPSGITKYAAAISALNECEKIEPYYIVF